MSDIDKNIAEVFGLETPPNQKRETKSIVIKPVEGELVDIDQEQVIERQIDSAISRIGAATSNARGTTDALLQHALEQIEQLTELAKMTEKPAVYEVLAQWVKMASDLAMQGIEINDKALKTIERAKNIRKTEATTDRIIKSGVLKATTAEVQKMLLKNDPSIDAIMKEPSNETEAK